MRRAGARLETAPMKMLSGLDGAFLHLETPAMPMHVGSLSLLEPPPGLDVLNFNAAGVRRFRCRDRAGKPVTELVIHETVTRSAEETVAVLKKRRLSVHLILDEHGRFTQHGDLANDNLAHASQHNAASVGIEVVNPYYPSYLKPGLPWDRVMKAPWAH